MKQQQPPFISTRRRFLHGTGLLAGSTLALPILPSLMPRAARANSLFPRRLVVFFSGNGTIRDNWLPTSEAGVLKQLSPILQPLERHLAKLTVIDGVENMAGHGRYQPSRAFHGHERGLAAVLTGTNLNLGSMEAGSGYANGISVDQEIANHIHDPKAIHSLQVGLATRRHEKGHYNRDTMSYAGPNKPLFHESNGEKLFSWIFGNGANGDELKTLRHRQKSVLDFLQNDLSDVQGRLSDEDRKRITAHHTAIRELEMQLMLPSATSCKSGASPTMRDWTNDNQMKEISEFQLGQTVQALACDRTRVATIQFGKALGTITPRLVGVSGDWHHISHEGDGNQEAKRNLTLINTYIAERFARLLDMMDSVSEGDGTLLDHSVVLWVNALGKGNDHTYHNSPVVMAGGLHGTFRTGGRLVTYNNRPNNDLLLTLCHAFGLKLASFGKAGLTTGPMTELLA